MPSGEEPPPTKREMHTNRPPSALSCREAAQFNQALQRTRPSRSGCHPRLPWAGSLSLGRSAFFRAMKLVISILFLLVAVVIPSQAAPQELPADAATALRAPTNIVLYSLE